MYLEKLEIQGFKSFAHKVELQFIGRRTGQKKGITAVVGPNGSGKSNIADAARWVLGEQSLKILRGKKSEDVIFAGSDKKARLGFAEVSLLLNNEDREAPIDYGQLLITRRLYRNGESEYLVNKKSTRLQDILILLAKCKFGQRSYSIIGQGMVDNFLFSPPAERKEFFEEAAGIREFQIKKDLALNKFKITREHLQQTEMLLLEIEPRVRSLTRQVKRLERREEVEKQLRELQSDYYGGLWWENSRRLTNLKNDFDQQEKRRQESGQEIEKIQNKLKELEKEASRSQIFNQLQTEYQKISETRSRLREKEIILKNKIQSADGRTISPSSRLPMTEILKELDDLDAKQAKIIQQVSQAKELGQLAGIKTALTELNSQLNKLRKKLQPISSEDEPGNQIKKELAQITDEMSRLNQQLEQAQTKIKSFNQEEETKRGELFNLQKGFQDKLAILNKFTSQTNELKIGLARVETRVEDLTREMKDELPAELIQQIKVSQRQPINKENIFPEIQKLKKQMELIGGIDPEAAQEYHQTKERYDFLKEQSDDLNKSLNSLEGAVEELQTTIKKHFDQSFNQINDQFDKYFKLLFNGGKAELVKLYEEEKSAQGGQGGEETETIEKEVIKEKGMKKEVMLAGVDIQATPPGKKIKNMNMLSGGERAMTSIALICAIIANNPSPFVILDEVDASLDEANSIKFAEILDKLSEKSQFVVITHNRATMQKAGVLYGVTMTNEGASRILSVKLEEAEATAQNNGKVK
ncbi:MAG: AAA family ATPase [bacterium]